MINNYDKIEHFCPECLSRCKYKKELTIDEIFDGTYIGSKTFCSKDCLENYKNKKIRKLSIYELEKAKYDKDEEFIEKYKKMYWKGYRVGDLFERHGKHVIKETIKNLDTSSSKDTIHIIANVAASSLNNGISCWVEDLPNFATKKFKNKLTIATNCYVGATFFQENEFISTGDNNIIEFKDSNLFSKISTLGYKYLALQITKIFMNKFHSWGRKLGSGNDFNREIILLPVLQDDQGNEEIFTDAMAYLYLKSMILKQDKKIQNYNNKIKELKGE